MECPPPLPLDIHSATPTGRASYLEHKRGTTQATPLFLFFFLTSFRLSLSQRFAFHPKRFSMGLFVPVQVLETALPCVLNNFELRLRLFVESFFCEWMFSLASVFAFVCSRKERLMRVRQREEHVTKKKSRIWNSSSDKF